MMVRDVGGVECATILGYKTQGPLAATSTGTE